MHLILLKKTLKSAYEDSPYYGRVLRSVGMYWEDLSKLEDVRKIPFSNKKFERERQEIAPPIWGLHCGPKGKDRESTRLVRYNGHANSFGFHSE